MSNKSIVSGYITVKRQALEQSREIIAAYPFDEIYPFTNIFWTDSPKNIQVPIIAFAGSYKVLEEVWNEWMWKFSQFLSALDAGSARVMLECQLGFFTWRLRPKQDVLD